MQASVVYFEHPGKANTDKALFLARQRGLELGVAKAVISSTTGFTARRALEVFAGTEIALTIVGINRGDFDFELAQQLEATCHHALFYAEVRDLYPEVVANAYRKICEGMKVIMQIASAAVEAGFAAEGEEIVAVAGTGPVAFAEGGGADTAVIMTPGRFDEYGTDYVPPDKLRRRRVREILCMPR